MTLIATQYEAQEWDYFSGKVYLDPFNQIELDVILSHESGKSWRVPAYWAGGQEWRVHFAPPLPGRYQAVTECPAAPDLHGLTLELHAESYRSNHPLLIHGPLRASRNHRTLEFSDGTPFFWLGDTWWMGLCKRLGWPEDFQMLTADRVAKGYNVIQIVAGLYPDAVGLDPRCANEGGLPWEAEFERINPAYFDMADLRIRWLVRQGLMPCIVSSWGYYLLTLGMKKMKQHWRYLVARWGAYPVVWCVAGEAAMASYYTEHRPEEEKAQMAGWTEITRYLREIDPYKRLVTIHPTQIGRNQILDDSLLDLNMLQTGHSGYNLVPAMVSQVNQEFKRTPTMPVLVSEVNYEELLHGCDASVQRLCFWTAVLSGACGFTYGANGIMQMNSRQALEGGLPGSVSWGDITWEEAYRLPGSAQLGLAKKLLERYEWWRFELHPEWTEFSGSYENINLPFCAGIPEEVRLIYFYAAFWDNSPFRVRALESGMRYRTFFWNPRNGVEVEAGIAKGDVNAEWKVPMQPERKDWVLVLDRKR